MLRGKEISEQIDILGDDGVPVDYHVTFWKSELIDFVILQQDAFDAIDSVCPLEQQEYMLKRVINICRTDFAFEDFLQVSEYFKRMINLFKQMNYAEYKSDKFFEYDRQIEALVDEKNKK